MNKQFKRYVAMLLVAITVAVSARGQYLHAIVFADTKDPKIGKSTLQDYYSFTVEASTIASAVGMKLKSYYYKDDDCSSDNLKNLLDKLHTGKDDVIMFYYSGHGARSAQDASDFPQMCMGSYNPYHFYPLEKVSKRLEKQPARLKLVIGDCCNSILNGLSPKNYETRSVTILSKEPVNVYNSLFANNKGVLIASGSKKGEYSICSIQEDGTVGGGLFTVCLLDVLKNYASKGMATTWEDVMRNTQAMTFENSSKWQNPHTPVYTVNVKEIPTATTTETQTYHEPQNQAVDDGTDNIDMITLLTAIGNENNTIESRVKVQEKALKVLFSSPNTKVEVVGSNGTTIVATEKASDFVLRLCTAHNLVNLVEVEKTLDNRGRYSYLRVHEIYKK